MIYYGARSYPLPHDFLEVLMDSKIFNVLDFGAVADGVTLNSSAVQAAVDACAEAGGGTVSFPVGDFVLSTVFLKSNVKIHISKGARILGALSFYDYAPEEKIDYPAYQDQSHTYFDCSMFVGRDCENIAIFGEGDIDMRSVWDEDNVRDIVHRGPKCIALKNCKNVDISGLGIFHATDLAVYFAGCENVDVHGLRMIVYIDGVSPDNSKNVNIYDCDIEAGDDSIVFKSSYTLNKIDYCKNIKVWNCRLRSRCNAIKFGTETNGGFYDIDIRDIDIRDVRITALCVESVDGAILDGIHFENIRIRNAGTAFFVHVGKRMRGPEGREVGCIRNVSFENIVADGPYVPHTIIPWNYIHYVNRDYVQYPWDITSKHKNDVQYTSNVCGLAESRLENISFKNIKLTVEGGIAEWNPVVPDIAPPYPEVYVYGKVLPAKGIFFRYVDGLTIENFTVDSYKPDGREDFVYEKVNGLKFD